jgi:hypothetical protein
MGVDGWLCFWKGVAARLSRALFDASTIQGVDPTGEVDMAAIEGATELERLMQGLRALSSRFDERRMR